MASMYKNFTFDAGAIVALGRDSIKDNITAVIELVKNSYDADAADVLVDINTSENFIRVCDTGVGMTPNQIDQNWLRIGYSEKRRNKKTNERGRRKTGEKGIGRLCAHRLGSELTIVTKSLRSHDVALFVDWKKFEKENIDAEEVTINVLSEKKYVAPTVFEDSKSGTNLIIGDLRQTWSKADIEELKYELSNLTPPFKNILKDFRIVLNSDVAPALNGQIESKFSQIPKLQLDAKFDGKNFILFEVYEAIKSRGGMTKKLVDSGKIKRQQLFESDQSLPFAKVSLAGPFDVSLMFFPQVTEYLDLVNIKRTEIQQFLLLNSGVKIYRDGVKVRPYGHMDSPEGDWLGLEARRGRDPAGAARVSFKVAHRQLVGGVFITRDKNRNLIDSSSREGLIHDDGYAEMKAISTWCVGQLEYYYHKSFIRSKKNKPTKNSSTDVKDSVQAIGKNVASVSSKLKKLAKEAEGELSDEIDELIIESEQIHAQLSSAAKDVEQLASQNTIFRVLATIGIASAVFGHETGAYLDQISLSLDAITGDLEHEEDEVEVESILEEVEKAVKAAETVSAWGKFALARVNRDKRRRKKVDVRAIIESVLTELKPILEPNGISLNKRLNSVEGRFFPMDIESVLINLITNAYTACKQKGRNRKIFVALTRKRVKSAIVPVLTVSDSGPGISKNDSNKIYEPLFTTKIDASGKPVGTGLGLTIVKSIIDDMGGIVSVDKDPELKGARFKVEFG